MKNALILFFLFLALTLAANPFPIHVQKGMILTQAVIEGEAVWVILDSGAPGLVLNATHYEADAYSGQLCEGINNSFECHSRTIDTWHWLGKDFQFTDALISDLTFLERALHRKIHALVGLSLLKDYYITIDYDYGAISLSRSSPTESRRSFSRFQYADHLAVISCKVNGEQKRLALDTGAEMNFLFDNAETGGRNHHSSRVVRVTGAENISVLRQSRFMQVDLESPAVSSSLEFVIHSSEGGGFQHSALDGLLGQAFLSRFNFTIHPGKQRIRFTPRESIPADMVMSIHHE